ncbi:MAG TPA: AarF/UbiB family protein [Vicinamibacterales bacterium]|nr:AarF/UbiB family protein [Vicinamibacterales bacterium]
MATPATAARQTRKTEIEDALRALGRPALARRALPPEGRLGAGEDDGHRLRSTLIGLGPVFAEFGLYLSSRFDLLSRRERAELRDIADAGPPLGAATVRAVLQAELGASPDRLFFEFHDAPASIGRWSERHFAWLSPGVPAIVTIVRPDADARLDMDAPFLPLLAPWIDTPADVLTSAIADFETTLRRRLDQRHQASSMAALASDARNGGGLDALTCYRDHSSAAVLTVERIVGETLDEYSGPTEPLAGRLTEAWLRQTLAGGVVPYDFTARDILVAGDRLYLIAGALEPHVSAERAHFAAYLTAVAADDPNEAASWIIEGAELPPHLEGELRRQLRRAVPFRDGEWSGDDRFAEQVLVQWRVARESGWPVSTHHAHVYRGLYDVARIEQALAPHTDTCAAALDEERLRIGREQAGHLLDPAHFNATLDRAIREMVELPQRIDSLLTMAAEGRLRTSINLPEADETERVRNRTVLLITSLVGFAGLVSVLGHLAPDAGVTVERAGAFLLLVIGGWLLFAAARL